MKIKFKKTIFSILLGFLAFSCSGLTAKEKYERGDYIGALESTAEELIKNKKNIPLEIENEIIFRIREIENRYNIQKTHLDEKNQSFAYFNLWNMGYIIEKNPILQKYTDFLSRNDNYKNLLSSTEIMKRYINYDINGRISSFDELIRKFKNANVKNSSYNNIYEEFARYGADIYIDKARSFENRSKLNEAREFYLKVIKTMEDFTQNYRDSAKKYNLITVEIDLNKANDYFNEAIALYNVNRLDAAKSNFENAKSLFAKHNMNRNVDQINTFLNDINRRIELNAAIDNYDDAKKLYNNGRFNQSKIKFENARRVFNHYGNYTLVREIDVYLENIKFKTSISEADRLFSEGERNYVNQRYKEAKTLFENALKIYQTTNERKNISRIQAYLENINNRLDSGYDYNENEFKKYFSRALNSFEKAENSYHLSESNYHYKKALEDFKMALKFTNNFRKEEEIRRYIYDIERKIKNDNHNDKYDNYFNFSSSRIEALNKLAFADSMYNKNESLKYYKEALELFKKALSFTNNNKEINEMNKYIEEVEEKILINSMNFDDLYKKAKEFVKIGDSKIKVNETNFYYEKAVKYFSLALKLTNNYDKRYEINNLIRDLKTRIVK